MIDLNEAPEQKESVRTAIPDGSIVPLKITVRQPKPGKQSDRCDAFSISSKGTYEFLDLEFEAQGTFSGNKIWEMYNFKCELVNGKLHFDGQDKTTSISMAAIRGMIESARIIRADDHSPQASAQRQISSFYDLNGLVCLAKVKCVVEPSQKDGREYINNKIASAGFITPDKAEYNAGEHISDKPLPTVPAPGEKAATTTAAAPTAAWGATPVATPATPPPTQTAAPVPAWASR